MDATWYLMIRAFAKKRKSRVAGAAVLRSDKGRELEGERAEEVRSIEVETERRAEREGRRIRMGAQARNGAISIPEEGNKRRPVVEQQIASSSRDRRTGEMGWETMVSWPGRERGRGYWMIIMGENGGVWCRRT